MGVAGVGEQEMGSGCLAGAEFKLRKMKKFWRRMRVLVAHSVDVPNATELCT